MAETIPNRKKITLAAIAAMQPGTTIWDTDIKGFCARRQRSSAITYLVKMRVAGRIRWFRIGSHGAYTPDQARRRAREILVDPASANKLRSNAPLTFKAVSEQFFASHGPKLKPRTLEEYRRLERLYLLPAFGAQPIDAIDRATISKAHARWFGNPRAANHALAVLSKLMTWTEDQGYRPENSNPCSRIQRYKENKRETFLTAEELGRLGVALDQAEDQHLISPYTLAAIKLLIFTGARLSEILTLEWVHIDYDRRAIFLPTSKTGKKVVTLNDAAISVLKGIPRPIDNPYVIVGNRKGMHIVSLQHPWQIVRDLAKLNCRIHDLRHTFASYAVAAGGSLPVIGRQLGHRQPITTQRYAHLADDPVQQLTQTTGQTLAAALKRKPA